MAAPTNASREKMRSPPTDHFLSSCAETREIRIFFSIPQELVFEISLSSVKLTKYRSVATDTRIRSSPTRTFSPSDLCLEAGCTVHQHASPLRIKRKTLRNSGRVTHEIFIRASRPVKSLPALLAKLFISILLKVIIALSNYS